MERSFTPAEANKTLPLVKRIVADILEKGRELRVLGPRQREDEVRPRIKELETELKGLLSELQAVGCEYKDFGFERGLVDFPAHYDGEDVYLCWCSDEAEVTHFHPVEQGFAGRQQIPAEWL